MCVSQCPVQVASGPAVTKGRKTINKWVENMEKPLCCSQWSRGRKNASLRGGGKAANEQGLGRVEGGGKDREPSQGS